MDKQEEEKNNSKRISIDPVVGGPPFFSYDLYKASRQSVAAVSQKKSPSERCV